MITYQQVKTIAESDVLALYTQVGWSAYTRQPVGLIRAVGDGVTILYIQDILVLPSYQDQGIGTQLMKTMLACYPEVRQKVLLTEEAPDTRHFYQKMGFSSCDKGEAVAFYREF